MNPSAVSPEALAGLPGAIWIPGTDPVCLYHGSPFDMVRQMAKEMGDHVAPRKAIIALVTALAFHKRIFIQLPEEQPDDVLAGVFIHALLDVGVGRALATA